MLLSLFNVLLGILRVFQGRSGVRVDFDEISALFMHLSVNLFRNVVDIRHELLHVVQLILPLSDDIRHVGGLALHFELLNVELLLFKKLLVVFAMVQIARAFVIHERLPPLDKIQVLRHLHLDLLHLLIELIDDLGQALVIRGLLLFLLALGAVGHTDLAVLIDLLLQVLHLVAHLLLLIVHLLAQIVIVPLRPNLFLKLDERAQVVLELGQLALNFDIRLA